MFFCVCRDRCRGTTNFSALHSPAWTCWCVCCLNWRKCLCPIKSLISYLYMKNALDIFDAVPTGADERCDVRFRSVLSNRFFVLCERVNVRAYGLIIVHDDSADRYIQHICRVLCVEYRSKQFAHSSRRCVHIFTRLHFDVAVVNTCI